MSLETLKKELVRKKYIEENKIDKIDINNFLSEMGYSLLQINQIYSTIKGYPEIIEFEPGIPISYYKKYKDLDIPKYRNKYDIVKILNDKIKNGKYVDIFFDNNKNIIYETDIWNKIKKVNDDIIKTLNDILDKYKLEDEEISIIINILEQGKDTDKIYSILNHDGIEPRDRKSLLKALEIYDVVATKYVGWSQSSTMASLELKANGIEPEKYIYKDCTYSKCNTIIKLAKEYPDIEIDTSIYDEVEIIALMAIYDIDKYDEKVLKYPKSDILKLGNIAIKEPELWDDLYDIIEDISKNELACIIDLYGKVDLSFVQKEFYNREELLSTLCLLDDEEYASINITDEIIKDIDARYIEDNDAAWYYFKAIFAGYNYKAFPDILDNEELCEKIYEYLKEDIDLSELEGKESDVQELILDAMDIGYSVYERNDINKNAHIAQLLDDIKDEDLVLFRKITKGDKFGNTLNHKLILNDKYSQKRKEILYEALFNQKPEILKYNNDKFTDEQLAVICKGLILNLDVLKYADPMYSDAVMTDIMNDLLEKTTENKDMNYERKDEER